MLFLTFELKLEVKKTKDKVVVKLNKQLELRNNQIIAFFKIMEIPRFYV